MWTPQHCPDCESTLAQVMAWCCQATSHYLNQCWHNYISPYDITRDQWVTHKEQTLPQCYSKKHFIPLYTVYVQSRNMRRRRLFQWNRNDCTKNKMNTETGNAPASSHNIWTYMSIHQVTLRQTCRKLHTWTIILQFSPIPVDSYILSTGPNLSPLVLIQIIVCKNILMAWDKTGISIAWRYHGIAPSHQYCDS